MDNKIVRENALEKTLELLHKHNEDIYTHKDGTYPELTVGNALNMKGNFEITSEDAYKPTGGDVSVASGWEAASIQNIKGNAVAWNQCHDNKNIKGKELILDNTEGDSVAYLRVDEYGKDIPNGHVVYENIIFSKCNIINKGINTPTLYQNLQGLGIGNSGVSSNIKLQNNVLKYSAIGKCKVEEGTPKNCNLMCRINSGNSIDAVIQSMVCIDLTLIYGAGNEPATPEQFEEDYQRWFGKPLTYEEYDEGSIRPVLATGVKTVGFNLYEGKDLQGNVQDYHRKVLFKNDCGYKGQIYIHADVETPVDTTRPTMRVYYTDGTSEGFNAGTTTKGVISGKTNNTSIVDYIILTYNAMGEFKLSNICINFSWSGKRDGEYEPHWEETKALPITTLKGRLNGEGESVTVFPDGMKRVREHIYDEIIVENGITKAIKRIGCVNLGTFEWNYDVNTKSFATKTAIPNIFYNDRNENFKCNLYTFGLYLKDRDMHIWSRRVFLRNDNFTPDDIDSLTESLQNAILYYELAEPEEYILDDFELPIVYRIDDFGTEEIIQPNDSIAPIITTKYGLNAVDAIRNLPAKFNEIEDRLKELTALAEEWKALKAEMAANPNEIVAFVNGELIPICNINSMILTKPIASTLENNINDNPFIIPTKVKENDIDKESNNENFKSKENEE